MRRGTAACPQRIGVGLLAIASLLLAGCDNSTDQARRGLSLEEAMSPGGSENFLRAEVPREFRFPQDHGPHPGFQTEWWYLVGNLGSDGGRFGYQITFFRSTLQPPRPPEDRGSAWATSDVYMAHLALTDIGGERFHAFERFSRGALGLAGATTEPFGVWLDDWSLRSTGEMTLPLRLRAAEGSVEVDLRIDAGKPPVLQGDGGLSRKGSQPGNASYYYSLTRLPTRGTVRIGSTTLSVSGDSWMDREWSTSALEEGQVGWDWFALQHSDGRDLMVYRMRLEGDRTDPSSSGVIVESDGGYEILSSDDFGLEVLDRWRSPSTGIDYPARWRIRSSVADVDLAVEPVLAGQEHTGSILYWEGAVRVEGSSRGEPVSGRGYMELAGYRDPTGD